MMTYLQNIGNTPLLPVPEFAQPIWTKHEETNPSGSHYDRAYARTIERLYEEELIMPGTELRDISSGSAARSLAYIGKLTGNPVRVTMPGELPKKRIEAVRAYGAEVIISTGEYVNGASVQQRKEIRDLIEDKRWQLIRPQDPDLRSLIFEKDDGTRVCYVNHSENTTTVEAFSAIGHELVAQCPKEPAAIALAIGNWTTIHGIVPVIKRAWPKVKVIGYQGVHTGKYENFGTGNFRSLGTDVPCRFKDETLLDEFVIITNRDRDKMETAINSRRTPREKVGRSSLMGLCVATQIETFRPVLTITYDLAEMY